MVDLQPVPKAQEVLRLINRLIISITTQIKTKRF